MNHYANKKSLALLGHGKWKSALGHTLLIIGLVLGLGGMNVWAQDAIPEAVKLDKKFIPDDATGHSGKIVLETYVTGNVTQVTATQPTDIVLVLDYSMSMNSSFPGASSRRAALEQSVEGFIEAIQHDADSNKVEHRIAVVKFSSQSATSILSVSGHPTWGNGNNPSTNMSNQYPNALVVVNDNGSVNPLLTNTSLFTGVGVDNGTVMNAGLRIAYQILQARTETDFEVPGTTQRLPRNMVVVFFTDGYPTASHGASETTMHNYWQTSWDCHTVANNSCAQAANIKNLAVTSGGQTAHPTIFSIGIHADCDPTANYKTEYHTRQRPTYPETGYYTGDKCLNGLLHFISSDYDGTLTSWTENTTTTDFRNNDYYLAPQNTNDLIERFGKIASQSGGTPVNLGTNTVIQDVISPSFTLPEGADVNDIIVYAPKVDTVTGTEGNYVLTFADTTTVKVNNQVQFLTMVDGVVQDDDAKENRINPNDVLDSIGGKTLRFTGFDFSKQFCGPKTEGGEIIGCEGRKLVIVFPIEIEEGVWGDDIETNGPLSFVTPDGELHYQFPLPEATVTADVWTEIIREQPSTFDTTANPIPLYTPEDLAWFISWVNGRLLYEPPYNTIKPHPNANAILMADLDMSAHNWVAIGEGVKGYTGTFDGNGHVITGLKNNASKYYKLNEHALVYPGMFSNVKGTVKNVFVLDADFRAKNHVLQETDEFKTFMHFGIIADTLTGGQIFNCEAAGRITCNTKTDNLDRDSQMIFGGLVGYNNGGTIHSCMAMAELSGYNLGGAVGLNSGSFSNSFTNGVYNYMDNGVTGKYVGGIAAQNTGTVNNCYVRFERANQNLNKVTFDMLVANGNVATNSYIPQIETFSRPTTSSTTSETNTNNTIPNTPLHPEGNPTNSYTLSVTPTFYNMYVNDNMTGGHWDVYLGRFNVYVEGYSLLDTLNAKRGNGAIWKRTTAGAYSTGAGDINDDYPVLAFDLFGTDSITCLGSADGIRIDYATSLNDMLHRHNSGEMNANSAYDKYKMTGNEAIYKGTINLFRNDDVTLPTTGGGKEGVADNSTAEGVVVYIDENISLLQDEGSNIEAYTGQTLRAYDNEEAESGERWHNISSSLKDSKFGWSYGDNEIVPSALSDGWESWAESHSDRDPRNPCLWTLPNTDEDHAFFPIDIFSYHRVEFYCFYEPQYHWLNFRRNKLSHWHMDNPGLNIPYSDQEDHFIPGKGYLSNVDMSQWWNFEFEEQTYPKQAQFLQNRGTLNNGNIEIAVTCDAPEWTGLKGYNLLGNPYQSYLDFNTFAWKNSGLWNDSTEMTYAIYDPSVGKYLQGSAGAKPSEGALAATGDINMHQGFFVKVSKGDIATFTNDMRSNEPASGTHFRSSQPNYPLVNLIATDAAGNSDIAVLEVGRPENGGAQKLRVGSAKGRISLRHDNTDFGILFRDITEGSQPLYFETEEDGTFTLSWNTANANFSSLTLVDNLTGARYDMLANNSYSFEGKASDYRSRFKVVIGRFTDVEENEEVVTDNFAFFDGSDWVVNGQGQLTITDMTGRTVYTSNLTNDQNRVSLNGVANGIYLMRVANGQNVNVQKIIIK